jgi:hypothetical protein
MPIEEMGENPVGYPKEKARLTNKGRRRPNTNTTIVRTEYIVYIKA